MSIVDDKMRVPTSSTKVSLSLLVCYGMLCLATARSAPFARSRQRLLLLSTRGGADRGPPPGSSSPIMENPNWKHRHDHKVWIESQAVYQQNHGTTTVRQTVYFDTPSPQTPVGERLVQYGKTVQKKNPEVAFVSIACLVVFLLWRVPSLLGTLQGYFVLSSSNLRQGKILCLLLYATSHISLSHLLTNLVGLLRLGPLVQSILSSRSPEGTSIFLTTPRPAFALWPYLVSAALIAALVHLAFCPEQPCLGLSGVTCSLLAFAARRYPTRRVGVAVSFIYLYPQARQLLLGLLLGTLVDMFLGLHSDIAHFVHLGGFLHGFVYYELWKRQDELRKLFSYSRRAWLKSR